MNLALPPLRLPGVQCSAGRQSTKLAALQAVQPGQMLPPARGRVRAAPGKATRSLFRPYSRTPARRTLPTARRRVSRAFSAGASPALAPIRLDCADAREPRSALRGV